MSILQMPISVDQIKLLRDSTGAGIADCRVALEQSLGNVEKAEEILRQKGLDKALSKESRMVSAGVVDVYSHAGRVGVVVELLCETDFVARTDDFKILAHELSLQIASMNPQTADELLTQEYIKDPSLTVDDLIKSSVAKLGENIQVGHFSRIELGK